MGLDLETTQLTIATVRDGLRGIHKRIRNAIEGLDREALNWKPHPDANSIAVLITHTLESEHEMLAAVRGVTVPRNRPSEFVAVKDREELIEMVDRADAWLVEQTSAMTGADLVASRPRADNPVQAGVYWLVANYGHAREHLAQMELTKQLYEAAK